MVSQLFIANELGDGPVLSEITGPVARRPPLIYARRYALIEQCFYVNWHLGSLEPTMQLVVIPQLEAINLSKGGIFRAPDISLGAALTRPFERILRDGEANS